MVFAVPEPLPDPEPLPVADLLVEVCALLPVVVVAVSVVFVHDATNATPATAIMHERMYFFIGVSLSE